jgi:membrane protein implicated in regulation of membrane protease activity
MCHLILSMPFLALALFYFLPFKTALTIYTPILFLSVFIYYKIKKAMELPPKGGMDEMLGKEGEVVHSLTTEARVKVNDEIWNARSEKELKEGEKVRIAGFDGLTLIVRPSSAESARKSDKELHD